MQTTGDMNVEQALQQLRNTRSIGHDIGWDNRLDAPSFMSANCGDPRQSGWDGVALDGFFCGADFEALAFLLRHARERYSEKCPAEKLMVD